MENQNKIISLEKEVKDLKTELKTETIAHNLMLDKERKQVQALQTQISNYESQKQASERIIQQLKREVQELRLERLQNANLRQELALKDQQIQELTNQLETMTNLLGQELISQVEFSPKG